MKVRYPYEVYRRPTHMAKKTKKTSPHKMNTNGNSGETIVTHVHILYDSEGISRTMRPIVVTGLIAGCLKAIMEPAKVEGRMTVTSRPNRRVFASEAPACQF